ncbi:ribonuclease H-like domain-containing protein [Xylariales sp. AK1849]|nr:ribonuclease H-like domain-containing protein [Xylariales sp. AK1849]
MMASDPPTSPERQHQQRITALPGNEGQPSRGYTVGSARPSKPIVFLPRRVYPIVVVQPTTPLVHRNNQYTTFSYADQEILFEALKLRCHTEQRLLAKRFILPGRSLLREELHLPQGINAWDLLTSPPPSSRKTRRVVALDCEMVGVSNRRPEDKSDRSELGQLCVVDVLTGEILIDKLVRPAERVVNWRTRYSGISYPAILAAKKNGRLLHGWRAARAELLGYVDSDTILIGHDITNDLHILRLMHGRFIDTTMQTAEAVYGDVERFPRTWGLKDLANTLLKIQIQVGKRGHDCAEDTLATRELALWCLCYPDELEAWAACMRIELEQKRVEREKKLEEERMKQEAEEAKIFMAQKSAGASLPDSDIETEGWLQTPQLAQGF